MADGLGNPTGNAIFQCQLKDIHEALKSISSDLELVSDNQRSVAFWLDTLCIPVDKELQDLRDFSIQEMRNIYKNASAVLVLDPDLRTLTLDSSHAEFFCRVLSCNWGFRLWTYQEAALSDRLILRGDDCLLYYDKILEEYANRASSPRISTSLEIVLARYCQETIPRSLPAVIEHEDDGIQALLHKVTDRVTSRPGDETICISTNIGLDPLPFLHTSPENRMRILLEMLPNIPANILFSSGSRIQQEGFRWAPRTLHASPNTTVRRAMTTPDGAKRPMAYLHPDRKGLVTFLPAIQLCGLSLSAFLQASRAYLDMGDGRLTRIGPYLETRVGHSWPEDTQNLAILLPFSGRITPRLHHNAELSGTSRVLIETGRQAAQPSPFPTQTGMLSLADYLGTVTFGRVDKDAVEVDIKPIHGKLEARRWWLVDGIPFPSELVSHGSETRASQVDR